MTTVINLNILNFFRLKFNRYTTNDVRFNTRISEKKQDQPGEKDHIIDVTPYSRVMSEAETAYENNAQLPAGEVHHPQLVHSPLRTDKTYDREGRSIQSFLPKGTQIDSYA